MERREFLRAMSLGAGSLAMPQWLLGADTSEAHKRATRPAAGPNIVIIMADDMGFSDIGCYGGEIQTPNLDKLAAGGLRFTQFYNTARCCPTRASLLTGLYPHQAGVGHMVGNYHRPGYMGHLADRCVTIAEVLRVAGYTTLMSGKWHVGENRPHWPVDRGFDEYFGLISGASNYWKLDSGRKMARNDKPYTPRGKGFYMTDAFTDHAVKFIDAAGARDKPFFLYVAYTAPHWPLHAWPKDIAKYQGRYMKGWDKLRSQRHARMIRMGLVEKSWPITPRDKAARPWSELDESRKKNMDLRMAIYAAQVDRMDQNIGRIVSRLKKHGILDNTLIMFLADNGGCAEGGPWGFTRGDKGKLGAVDSWASYGLSWANASNTPFRLYKHWVHEGGIATPLIAHWPKVIGRGGRITHQVGHLIDLMATCCDAAGATYPGKYKGRKIVPLAGRSLLPILQGKKRKGHEAIYWEHEGNQAIRKGKWKLVSRHPGEWELYDVVADRTETNNLAGTHAKVVRELKDMYDQWAKRSYVERWPVRKKRRNKPKEPKTAPRRSNDARAK